MTRRLRAEIRAVEEGHVARAVSDYEFLVKSDSELNTTWTVQVYPLLGVWYFTCTCHAGRHADPYCKHGQLVARRLEREGRAELKNDVWTYDWTPQYDDAEDPFDGLTDEDN